MSYLIPLLGFWPGLLFLLGPIWKDVAFATSMFFCWSILFNAYSELRPLKIFEIILICILSIYGFGVKTNGVVVLPFIFAFLIYIQRLGSFYWKQTIVFSLILTGVIVGVTNYIVPNNRVTKTFPFQYTQVYDLLAISIKTGNVLLPKYITDRTGKNIDELKLSYNLTSNDNFFYQKYGNLLTRDVSQIEELQAHWIDAITSYPKIYMDHRLNKFVDLLLGLGGSGWISHPQIDKNRFGFTFQKNNFSDWLVKTSKNFPSIYLPWVYLVFLMASSGVFLLIGTHQFLMNCVTGSALAFVIPHIFIAPASSYRYLYYMYFCSCVITFFAIVLCGHYLWIKIRLFPKNIPPKTLV